MQTTLNGHDHYYETYGEPSGEPVVFLHGFSQNLSTWYPVRDELLAAEKSPFKPGAPAGRLRIVLLDLIGHGRSAKPHAQGAYTIASIVEALEELRAELGAQRLHLVGYSMGGRLALSYAAAHPDAVASLVLESAAFGPRGKDAHASAAESDRALADRLRASTAAEFAQWWAATPVLRDQGELPAAALEAQAAMRAANDTEALARVVLGAGQAQMGGLLGDALGLGDRAMYVCGERDSKYKAIAEEASAAGLRVRCLPTGHNVHLEMPVEYAGLLLEFFGSIREGTS